MGPRSTSGPRPCHRWTSAGSPLPEGSCAPSSPVTSMRLPPRSFFKSGVTGSRCWRGPMERRGGPFNPPPPPPPGPPPPPPHGPGGAGSPPPPKRQERGGGRGGDDGGGR